MIDDVVCLLTTKGVCTNAHIHRQLTALRRVPYHRREKITPLSAPKVFGAVQFVLLHCGLSGHAVIRALAACEQCT